MRALLVVLVACGATGVRAQTTAALPVLVQVREHEGQRHIEGGGLIGTWAINSMNKNSARKVEYFMRMLGTGDFPTRAQAAFACFATTAPCSSPPALADADAFAAAVRSSPAQEGFAIDVLPELVASQLLIRATAFHVKLSNDVARTPIRVGPGYHVLFTTRAPADIAAQKKKNPAALEAYWSEGQPRRIDESTRRGLAQLNALFAMMINHEGKSSDPSPTLTNAWDFPDKKRLACKGAQLCRLTYVYKDNGDSFVLLTGPNVAGWLDAAAAADESNLPSMATFGVPR